VLSSERTLYFVALEWSLTVELQGPRLNDINRGMLVNNDIMQAARLGELEAIRTALRHGTSALGQNIMGHTGNNTKPSGTYPNPSKQKCQQSSYTNIWFFFFYWEGEREIRFFFLCQVSASRSTRTPDDELLLQICTWILSAFFSRDCR
jgi:hypothetical protein